MNIYVHYYTEILVFSEKTFVTIALSFSQFSSIFFLPVLWRLVPTYLMEEFTDEGLSHS
jgi:hypothetical protein